VARKTTIGSLMPKGPKGEKRPADVIGNAVKVMRIAVGEESDAVPDDGKNKAAQALGRKGALKRFENTSKLERKEIAQKAAKARWSNKAS
jgi:hypothetical protein